MLFMCIWFVWQGFGSGGLRGVASVRRYQKCLPCPTEPVPAGSQMDPLLAKEEHISDGGRTSKIIYLQRGKPCATAGRERSERRETALQTLRLVK